MRLLLITLAAVLLAGCAIVPLAPYAYAPHPYIRHGHPHHHHHGGPGRRYYDRGRW